MNKPKKPSPPKVITKPEKTIRVRTNIIVNQWCLSDYDRFELKECIDLLVDRHKKLFPKDSIDYDNQDYTQIKIDRYDETFCFEFLAEPIENLNYKKELKDYEKYLSDTKDYNNAMYQYHLDMAEYLKSQKQMNIRCLFGHEWDRIPIKIHHYIDSSWGGECPSSNVIFRCKHCYKLKKEAFYNSGFLEMEDFEW